MNTRRLFIPFLLLALFSGFGFAQSADMLVDFAWLAWNRNDQAEVERYFLAAEKADTHSLRAPIWSLLSVFDAAEI